MSLGPLMTDFEGTSLSAKDREILSHPLVGGVILFSRNYENPQQIAELTAEIHALRTPQLLIAVDHEGGRVQRFRTGFSELPAAAVIGQVYDQDASKGLAFAEQCGWLMAAELRSVGVDFSFAPVLDLRNARSRIIDDRAFHSDPHVVGRLAHAYISGMHSADMAAIGKHYPGHGTVVADSHLELPVDERSYFDLTNSDLIPFRLTADKVEGLMPAHIVYPQVDALAAGYSPIWLRKILREELRFQGVIFSDDLSMSGAAQAGSVAERASAAIDAGCDMVLLCNDRPATVELLATFKAQIEPLSLVRLMRMHRKNTLAPLDRLALEPRWLAANAAIAKVGLNRELNLGDDMLT